MKAEERRLKVATTEMTPEDRLDEVRRRISELDQVEPQITLKLKGEDYTLEFNVRVARLLFKECGIDILGGNQNYDNIEHLSALLYYGLKEHHQDLTQDQLDKMVDMRQRLYIVNRLSMALKVFLPDVSDLPATKPREVEKSDDPLSLPLAAGSASGPLPEDSEFLMSSSEIQP